MVGLSLSFCVRDIVTGEVPVERVTKILCGTKTLGEWDSIVEEYCRTYWRDYPKEATEVFERLLAEGKLFEPRSFGQEPPNLHAGHWLAESEEEREIVQKLL